MNIIQYENYQEKKERGNFGFPYITYPCSIPLDFTRVPLHWHDEMEFVYIKQGQGIVSVDFTVYQVTAGDIVIILPGQLHTIEQQPDRSMEYETIIFELHMLTSLQGDFCTEAFFLPMQKRLLLPPSCLRPDSDFYEEVKACLDRADDLCDRRPPAYQVAVKGQLFQLFYLLFSHALRDTIPSVPHKSLEKTKLILKYIETHYGDTLTVKEMAGACGFSQSHFMKFFKSAVGESFTSYLNHYRLTMASRLLLSSGSCILEIAEEAGFRNLSYFNRTFKNTFGMTPREFRAKNRNQSSDKSPASSFKALHWS